jgi:ABC-type glycerol-3-phosphate transport system permease component
MALDMTQGSGSSWSGPGSTAFAASVMSTAPVILAYLFAQRYLVSGAYERRGEVNPRSLCRPSLSPAMP